ncbi:MAG: DMT family transporter [Patescibacteria group bacterium]|nr:DMT family transporter [Patescibacteria group bacterium]
MNIQKVNPYILLLIVSMIWGIAGPVIKHTLAYFPTQTFLAYRFFLSSLPALAYFVIFPKNLPRTLPQKRHVLIYSILTVVLGLGLLFAGFELTTSLSGTLIAATGPIFSIALGGILLREHITPHEIFGLFLAIVGSFLTVTPPHGSFEAEIIGTAMIGNTLILLSRVFDALGGVSMKIALKHGMKPAAMSHISFLIGWFVFFIVCIVHSKNAEDFLKTIIHAPIQAHLGVLYMAFISGTLGYTLFNTAVKRVELGNASLFSYLTVIWGSPFAILWLKESLTIQFLLGAGIITIGVMIAEWKQRTKKRKKDKSIVER